MTNRQAPLDSGFGAATTAAEVIDGIDLRGKVAIVTGGASGIGLETARVLRAAGADVIVPARDVDAARAALAGIEGVEVDHLDLVDPPSIEAFADRFLASGRPLHLLVNSAGLGGAYEISRDDRGYESLFATNHLGHFQLTDRLLPALRTADGSRVVAVSSWAHRYSPVNFDDPNYEHRPYDVATVYGQSKTANILFAVGLDARGAADGIRVFSLHPGTIVDSNFRRNTPDELLEAFGIIDADGNAILDPAKQRKTIEQGAATTVWCAVSPQLDGLGGLYADNCDLAPVIDVDDPDVMAGVADFGSLPLGVMPYAIDPDAAERLWALSERLVAPAT